MQKTRLTTIHWARCSRRIWLSLAIPSSLPGATNHRFDVRCMEDTLIGFLVVFVAPKTLCCPQHKSPASVNFPAARHRGDKCDRCLRPKLYSPPAPSPLENSAVQTVQMHTTQISRYCVATGSSTQFLDGECNTRSRSKTGGKRLLSTGAGCNSTSFLDLRLII